MVAIAKEAGFSITIAEFIRLQAQTINELSDEELENAAGGLDKNDKNLIVSISVGVTLPAYAVAITIGGTVLK